jgi:glutaredoxin-related protein
VPQVYIEGEYVGGYNELLEFLNKPIEGNDDDDSCRACEG